jgi:ribonucleotide reductase alpha subunit
MYSYTEALAASVEYFDGDELAAKVFVDKYALRDNDNNILEKTPDDMHHRLAKEFARIEKKKFKKPLTEDEILKVLIERDDKDETESDEILNLRVEDMDELPKSFKGKLVYG